MVKRTRRKKDWHHRVPDFKLVYCGTKKHTKEETKEVPIKSAETITRNAA